ncbi:MAG: cyclic pyranopterin monophosphate synthase MoaC [Cyclobacteriaceae bacterium]|nr:cyclic pyranopterin monophosphate synthase MoaC [Cyclobacteriaceae bacterium]
MNKKKLSHVDKTGRASMVDISGKPEVARMARAEGFIRLERETIRMIRDNQVKKGDVLSIAEFAGIQGAKNTSQLIPLCHPLRLTHVEVHATLQEEGIQISSSVKTHGPTGVEMEALTAVSVSLLTIYDMCKAVDHTMEICRIRLLEKIKGDGKYNQD